MALVEPNHDQLLSTAVYAQKGCQNVGADLFPTPTILTELFKKIFELFNSCLVIVSQFPVCSCCLGDQQQQHHQQPTANNNNH